MKPDLRRPINNVPFCRIFLLAAVCFTLVGGTETFAQQTASSTEVLAIISQLGDESFLIRERAKEKLQKLGLEAFDELQSAQYHSDNEVSTAARFLINSLLVSWSKESDPAEVRKTLHEYGAQDADERISRIQRIAALPDRQGLEALARLSRFESDLRLSRRAALELMQQTMKPDVAECRRNAETILDVLKDSDRQSAAWLRLYAGELKSQSYDVDGWRDLIKKQRREIDANTSEQSNRASVLSLVRTCAARATKLNKRNEAIELAVQNIDLIPPTTRDLVEACNWATDIELYEFVLAMQAKHARMFKGHARLLYGAAEAHLTGGDDADAKQLAEQALAIKSFPKTEEEKKELSENEIDEIAQAHLLLAQELLDRGLFDWAENEYQCIIDGVELTSITGAKTRWKLADMIGELLRHEDAANVLEPIVDRVRKDRILHDSLNMNLVPIDYMEGQLEFHRAMIAKKQGDSEGARKKLKQSYDIYSENVDVLIAMYRMDGNDDWKQTVDRLVASRTRLVENEVKQWEARVRLMAQQIDLTGGLSTRLNEYAWLVSNTTGDFDKALAASIRSLELTPDDAAKIDTCARCYMALGQWDKAKEMQERALKLMPHSPPMIRQLKEIDDQIAKDNR